MDRHPEQRNAAADSAERRLADALEAQRRETLEARRSLSDLRRRIEDLENRVEEAEWARSVAEEKLDGLRARRSVRAALTVSRLFRPLIRMRRLLRNRRSNPAVAGSAAERLGSSAADAVTSVAGADIIVCVHNAPDEVAACLTSLEEHTNLERHRLILVDDGSDEPTRQLLIDFASKTDSRLIRHDEALGYTRAANAGLRASTLDYAILLNSDTVVTPGWVDKLIRCAELNPDAGVVGPLSNAASWQSIPELTDEKGAWRVNELPMNRSASEVARTLDQWSPVLYPQVPLVNGFCYLITRPALEAVGYLDEDSFPRGYGEEDDFSIRCRQEGFGLYVADDCFVFHAKSRSFTPEGRASIVEGSKGVLAAKHGESTVRAMVDDVKHAEGLVRARTYASLLVGSELEPLERDFGDADLRIGWLQPHLGQVGGIRRTIEMSNRLMTWGWDIHLILPTRQETSWSATHATVITADDAEEAEYDLLICSDPDMVEAFYRLDSRTRLIYHLGAYMLYRPLEAKLERFYGVGTAAHHVANSQWTARQAEEASGVAIDEVFAGGVDRRQFHPIGGSPTHDVVCYGSSREHKGTRTIERAVRGRSLLKIADQAAHQSELARLISSGRVFASGCWHEGFNMMPLEAMACGVPVVMTDDGGSRDYAKHEYNAIVVPPRDAGAMSDAIDRVLEDRDLRARLIEGGLRTAWEHDWDDISSRFADYVMSITAESQGMIAPGATAG